MSTKPLRPPCHAELDRVFDPMAELITLAWLSRTYLADLDTEAMQSLALSQLAPLVLRKPPKRRGGRPGDRCAACGHPRREHCGCGLSCFHAGRPLAWWEDRQDLDAWLDLMRERDPMDLSLELSQPLTLRGCRCRGFRRRAAARTGQQHSKATAARCPPGRTIRALLRLRPSGRPGAAPVIEGRGGRGANPA